MSRPPVVATLFVCLLSCAQPVPPRQDAATSSSCPQTLTTCGQVCVDLSVNRSHCGACGGRCQSDEDCVEGVCAPLPPEPLSSPVRTVPACPDGGFACGDRCVRQSELSRWSVWSGGEDPQDVSVLDVDGDGPDDVLVAHAGYGGGGALSVHRGAPSRTLTLTDRFDAPTGGVTALATFAPSGTDDGLLAVGVGRTWVDLYRDGDAGLHATLVKRWMHGVLARSITLHPGFPALVIGQQRDEDPWYSAHERHDGGWLAFERDVVSFTWFVDVLGGAEPEWVDHHYGTWLASTLPEPGRHWLFAHSFEGPRALYGGAPADLDGDGQDEWVAVDEDGRLVAVRAQRSSDGGFAVHELGTGPSFAGSSKPRFRDVDGDGRLEYVAVFQRERAIGYVSIDADGGFGAPRFYDSIVNVTSVDVADVDGDGAREWVMTSPDWNELHVQPLDCGGER